MAQVVVYGRRSTIDAKRDQLSGAIHEAIMQALDYPPEKRFQRFIAMDDADFIYPEDRGDHYLIVEISMFEGRSETAKRSLIAALFARIKADAAIDSHSVEITITETPRVNWGIRGTNGADLALNYQVEI